MWQGVIAFITKKIRMKKCCIPIDLIVYCGNFFMSKYENVFISSRCLFINDDHEAKPRWRKNKFVLCGDDHLDIWAVTFTQDYLRNAFWAAAPKELMTYAFTHGGNFSFSFIPPPRGPNSSLKAQILLLFSRLKSQPSGSTPHLQAQIPASRPQFQPPGSNKNSIGHRLLRGRCPSQHLTPSYTHLGATGTADHLTLLRLFFLF